MKEPTQEEFNQLYKKRRQKAVDYLTKNQIGAAVFIDSEAHREPAIRYLTGHTGDAVLIIFENGKNVLIPWDEILARKQAFCDKLIPYTKYKNSELQAVQANLNAAKGIRNMKVELPPYITYPDFLSFIDALPQWDVRCKQTGIHQYIVEQRMIKDEYEIACTKEAARIGDLIIEKIEQEIKSGAIRTETDVALLIERELRLNGCERTGFDTLAAGPARSWAIHAFPGYTSGEWPGNGLSILDFGVVYNGYTSDTTLTVAKGPLSPQQEKLLNLVQAAADECLLLYKKDIPVKDAAERADGIFAAAKRKMPHTLGHAIGLEIHEYPRVSSKMTEDVVFKPGMIVTLEPGLYDEQLGGVRLENDVLITETGNEVITHSKILRIE
ncbi:M24 family metallopeptidase [Treponema porcinum]|uniref:M24 family metallopeptidase n=1 Tax=Treponema porcinum TaxID=261392 RepID=UPI0023543FB6|nr:Xaa-Pro peptidase family protein [Treponema porcinum]MCI7079845.1 Xaa-Pro peptidase family protein [Treponema porcinum]